MNFIFMEAFFNEQEAQFPLSHAQEADGRPPQSVWILITQYRSGIIKIKRWRRKTR